MIPATPLSLKQSLHKACHLVKPKREAIEDFKFNIINLLSRMDEKEREEKISKEKINIFLESIFQNTCFATDRQEPENSSPVCFATAGDLREGFEEILGRESPPPPNLNDDIRPSNSGTNRIQANADLVNAVQIMKIIVLEILKYNRFEHQKDNSAMEKQIDEIVYQLYELTPEEITFVEGL